MRILLSQEAEALWAATCLDPYFVGQGESPKEAIADLRGRICAALEEAEETERPLFTVLRQAPPHVVERYLATVVDSQDERPETPALSRQLLSFPRALARVDFAR